jgi:hypothetical protein
MVRDDKTELKDGAQLQAGVGRRPGYEAHVGPLRAYAMHEEEPSWDAGNERADEEPAEDPPSSLTSIG